MGSVVIILARALIVAPFLVPAVLAGLDYQAASAAFAENYPQMAAAFPVILGVKAVLALVLVLGLPFHRALAVVLAVVVVGLATVQAPFYNVIGDERVLMMQAFLGMVAQAGGLLLLAAMPKRG